MAASINEVRLLGNMTKDPDIKRFDDGGMMALFSLATNRTYKTDEGEKKDIAEFHNCIVRGKLAEVVEKYSKKGMKIYIGGRLETRKYQAKDGTDRYATSVVVQDFIMLGGKSSKADNSDYIPDDQDIAEEKAATGKTSAPIEPDDLPF